MSKMGGTPNPSVHRGSPSPRERFTLTQHVACKLNLPNLKVKIRTARFYQDIYNQYCKFTERKLPLQKNL